MANSFTFNQIATILNTIVQDATGRGSGFGTTPRTTKEFVTVAQTGLNTAGVDPIMGAISNMIAKTVFSVRPYNPAIRLIDQTELEYGNAVRKITPEFVDAAESQPMWNNQPADGQSTDQYTIKRPKALETHFVGFDQAMVQAPTVFEDQLRTAFTGPEQLGDFLAAQATAVQNELNSQKEALIRNTIANFIGAKFARSSTAIVHVLTQYNAATGLSLTATSVMQPGNFEAFVKWFYALVEDFSGLMQTRSVLYHEAITGYTIMRHTPKAQQRLYLYSPLMKQIKTMALSGIYNDDLLKMDVSAPIEYWQSITDRMKVSVDCSYTAANGTVANSEQTQDKIIGLLFDKEAMGVNVHLQSVNMTPLNAKGRYWNTFHHFAKRYYNDITENAIVFVLD